MATQYDPIAKDASLNTTESPSRNLADVLAQSLAALISAMPATVLNNLADVVITLPTDGQTLKYDSVSQKWVNADDAGGHTIVDASDTDMPQRANMQFLDAGVSDDAVNDVTEIEVVQEISAESDLTSAPDGVYQGTWEEDPSDVLTADMVGYGSGTVEDALDDMTSGTLIYPVVFATSQVGNRYYAALPTLPKNKTATLTRVNVLGTGDVSVSNYTLAYDPITGYAFMFSTSNTDWSGKAVHAYIEFT